MQRADIHGKRTQEGVGATPPHLSVITPLSFMLAGLVEPAWQNGGSNQVIVPSGDRTKPEGAPDRMLVIAPSSLILVGDVLRPGSNEVKLPCGSPTKPNNRPLSARYLPVIAPASLMMRGVVPKLPGGSNDTIVPSARRTKPCVRLLALAPGPLDPDRYRPPP